MALIKRSNTVSGCEIEDEERVRGFFAYECVDARKIAPFPSE